MQNNRKSRLLLGSINFTRLTEQLQAKNKCFYKTDKGEIYASVKVWVSDEVDQFKNNATIQLNPEKESNCESSYVGNFKFVEIKPKDLTDEDLENIPDLGSIDVPTIGYNSSQEEEEETPF